MLEQFVSSLLNMMQPSTLLLMFGGAVLGLIFGALPGLTATMGVAVMLPLTFALDPNSGLALLMSVYIGGVSGGLVSATLLRMPGTPSSVATTFDGYPLAQRGEAAKALGTGILGSFFGGLFSLAILMLIAPYIARLALRFGPYEYFALTLFALSLVSALSRGILAKGTLSALLGLAAAVVGVAPIDGGARYTFGNIALFAGFGVIPFMVGLFAISQMIRDIQSQVTIPDVRLRIRGFGVTLREIKDNLVNIVRSALIGVGIGILPGIGGAASNLIAYAAAKQSSKNPEKFGTGTVDGVWASETANNASVGGALVPLMTLGIPGDGVTAVLLGGFIIHGLQPGPLLFRTNPDIVTGIYAAFFIVSIMVLAIMFGAMRIFPRILLLPRHFLFPILLVLTVIGAFASNNRVFDVWVMLTFGIVGFFLEKYGFPLSPLVLGFVLGPVLELNLRRALMFSQGDLLPFITQPFSALFLGLTVLSVIFALYSEFKDRNKTKIADA